MTNQQVLYYRPQVRAFIVSGKTQIDVSRDIVAGNINRVLDGASSWSLTLNNKGAKYTNVIKRMDRIAIWLYRKTWVQVMSGYVSVVPAVDLYPLTCTISGQCTLKRLMYKYWDPGLQASTDLLTRYAYNYKDPDAGIGKTIIDVLTEVGDWPKKQIQIQAVPQKIFDIAKQGFMDIDAESEVRVDAFLKLLNPNGAVSGSTSADGASVPLSGTDPKDAPGLNAFLWAMAGHESNHNYKAQSSISSASGAFQYIDSTWNNYGGYKRAYLAPAAVQNQRMTADSVPRYKKYGSWWAVATIHFTGHYVAKGTSEYNSAPSPGNPTVRSYVEDIEKRMGQYPGNSNSNASDVNVNSSEGALGTLATKKTPDGSVGTSNPGLDLLNAVKALGTGKRYSQTNRMAEGYFDCSSLVARAGNKIGVWSGQSFNTSGFADNFRSLGLTEISRGSVQAGDIVLWIGGANSNHIGVAENSSTYFSARSDRYPLNQQISSTSISGRDKYAGRPCRVFRFNEGVTASTPLAGGTNGEALGETGQANFLNPYDGAIAEYKAEDIFTGRLALANDVQLLGTIQTLTAASMRRFQSMPNGDFVAFYPDYYGMNLLDQPLKKQAILNLEDIELVDVSITLSDAPMTTHVFVVADADANLTFDDQDIVSTRGVVTVEDKWVKELIKLVMPAEANTYSLKDIYKVFGARPLMVQNAAIKSPEVEFFVALQTFLKKWAEQSSTRVQLSFMPELYPGMRVRLVKHNLGMFVEAVTHSFDFESGFTTTAVLSSPTSLEDGTQQVGRK